MDYQSLALTPLEKMFIDELEYLLHEQNLDTCHLQINRMGDKTLNFRLTGCQIGRIKLQGIPKMQVLTDKTVRWYQDEPFVKSLARLKQWIAYAKKPGIYDPSRSVPW